MAAEVPLFQYDSIELERKSIRLIRLSNCLGEPLRCHMFNAFLEDPGDLIEFEALSYTCGGADVIAYDPR